MDLLDEFDDGKGFDKDDGGLLDPGQRSLTEP